MDRETTRGMLWGVLGVAIFGFTLPFTRLAVVELDALFIALGRAVLASLLAAIVLLASGATRPPAALIPRIALAAACVVVGFPVATTIAMVSASASHGAVILGLLPLITALFGALRAGERPSPGFWICAVAGSALVVWFALREGGGVLTSADLLLAFAVVAASFGYAEGAVVARSLGGWQTISWILVFSAPFLAPPVLWLGWTHQVWNAGAASWIGFLYVSVFSMFLGFFAWYRGLALGGVARVSQVQLLQAFFTLIGASLVAGEKLRPDIWIFCFAVVAMVALGRRMAVGSIYREKE